MLRSGCRPGNTGNVVPLDDTAVPDPIVESTTDPAVELFGDLLVPSLAYLQDNVLCYIGGWIIRKALSRGFCIICCEALMDPTCSTPASYLTLVKDLGGLFYACGDLVKLLTFTEKLIKASCYPFHTVIRLVLEKFGREGALFSSHMAHFSDENVSLQSHYYSLLRFTVETYFHFRMHALTKAANRRDKLSLRNSLTKKILFMNQ